MDIRLGTYSISIQEILTPKILFDNLVDFDTFIANLKVFCGTVTRYEYSNLVWYVHIQSILPKLDGQNLLPCTTINWIDRNYQANLQLAIFLIIYII